MMAALGFFLMLLAVILMLGAIVFFIALIMPLDEE